MLSTPVGAGALGGAVAGAVLAGWGAAEVAGPAGGAGDADPGEDAFCPDEAGTAGAGEDESHDGDDEADEPDAADEGTGAVAPPDPYPVDVLRGANWLPASSMTPSTAPVSSVIEGVSSFTPACTRKVSAGVQRRR